MAEERLQKIIARAGVCSRRAAEELIRAGRISVDGEPATIGDKADAERQRIEVDGRPLELPEDHHYLVLYKPRGVITSLDDEKGRRDVGDLLRGYPRRVFPVGRLDRDSEGLLLLTDDGGLAAKLLHPRYHVVKRYLVSVRGPLRNAGLKKLAEGVELEDGRTLPAGVRLLERTAAVTRFYIDLYEGRNRQIRRMCESLGYRVSRLKRIKFGTLELGDLQPGRWRRLRPGEVQRLREEIRGARRGLRRFERGGG